MIRVNLLEGTAEQRVSLQKTKVVARRGQQLFMLASALLIFLIAIGVDHLWTNNAQAAVQEELAREQEEARKLEQDIKRKEELEGELKQVEERIKVIKQLRAEQKGPVAMLSSINERMPGGKVDFRLHSIEQKGSRVRITGTSTNQQVIADFASQLEFSNGLFTSLSLSVEGREAKPEELPENANAAGKKDDGDEKPQIFRFTIDCDYNKPRAEGDDKKVEES
ncbi:MAG: PilN domain-containing protein [Blastocatellia bacterium]|nr:PilN domain-containing protein [Blastocatellia bacterium]